MLAGESCLLSSHPSYSPPAAGSEVLPSSAGALQLFACFSCGGCYCKASLQLIANLGCLNILGGSSHLTGVAEMRCSSATTLWEGRRSGAGGTRPFRIPRCLNRACEAVRGYIQR